MVLCGDDIDPFDFQSQCIRELWGSFLPAALVLILCSYSIPIPRVFDILFAPFKPYLTLPEAEALDNNTTVIDKISNPDDTGDSESVPLWRAVVLVFVGIFQCLCWIAHGSFRLYNDPRDVFGGVLPFLVAIPWLYTTIRPVTHPIATSPFDLFSIYLVLFCVGFLQIGGIWFNHNVFGSPWPSTLTLVALSTNLLALLVLLVVVLNIPLALPSNRINKKDIVSHSLSFQLQIQQYAIRVIQFLQKITHHSGDGSHLVGSILLSKRSFSVFFSTKYPFSYFPIGTKCHAQRRRCLEYEPNHAISSNLCQIQFNIVSDLIYLWLCMTYASCNSRSTLLRRIWAANSLDLMLVFYPIRYMSCPNVHHQFGLQSDLCQCHLQLCWSIFPQVVVYPLSPLVQRSECITGKSLMLLISKTRQQRVELKHTSMHFLRFHALFWRYIVLKIRLWSSNQIAV